MNTIFLITFRDTDDNLLIQVVSLEVDENTGYNLKKPKHCVSYSRAAGEYVVKTRYTGKTYLYRQTLMDDMRSSMKTAISPIDWSPYIKVAVPKNIRTQKRKPALSELLSKRIKRI